MKKLILILTMVFAFTLNVNAQEAKKSSAQMNARTEANMLTETVGLKASQTEDFYRLFEMKYNTLEDKSLSTERKNEFLNIVMLKVQATLTAEQMRKFEADTELYNRVRTGTIKAK